MQDDTLSIILIYTTCEMIAMIRSSVRDVTAASSRETTNLERPEMTLHSADLASFLCSSRRPSRILGKSRLAMQQRSIFSRTNEGIR